ncbi:globin [Marilutibacter alkalisoli]|uniref:Globin n=1 Tax=Marilutibacter alkalisoli TaxID=2591633 RepID=A0A514BQG5_9GAMM|nr:globin [Lysobacter alkalisoli]QDH69596.1 globin [Lysobacter alkalisoli]
MTDTFNDLQRSYGRCLAGRGFIERFYEIFMDSHPDVAPMFANTDFRTQRLALRRGISVAILHAGGSTIVGRTCTHMAAVHGRQGRAPVPPALYPYWVDSMLAAIAEYDPEADEALLARWRLAMSRVVDLFSRQY